MTCKRCAVSGCNVLIVGKRDLCERHFNKLTLDERTRLDDLRDDGREVYGSALTAAVEKLERKTDQVNAFGYPVGPVLA